MPADRLDHMRVPALVDDITVTSVCEESLPAVSTSGYLTLEEIERFVRVVGKLGVSKIRITGGEPLLRNDIVDVVKRIRDIDTVRDLSITTNGSLLEPLIMVVLGTLIDGLVIALYLPIFQLGSVVSGH